MLREFYEEHKGEVIVLGIMFAVSFAIGLAITGDFNEALARTKRR